MATNGQDSTDSSSESVALDPTSYSSIWKLGWPVMVGMGTVNVIYGDISAMGKSDLKYVVGYYRVSHMG